MYSIIKITLLYDRCLEKENSKSFHHKENIFFYFFYFVCI